MDQAGLYRALSAETGLNLDDDADWQALLEEVRDDDAAPEPVYVIGEEENQSPAQSTCRCRNVAWDELAPEDTRAPAPLPADFVPELPPASLADVPGARRASPTASRGAAQRPSPTGPSSGSRPHRRRPRPGATGAIRRAACWPRSCW